jgi:hypothetical protein
MKTATNNVYLLKNKEISEISATLSNLPLGRVYAGLPIDFGQNPQYKFAYVPLFALVPQLGFDSFGYPYTHYYLASEVLFNFSYTKQEQYNLFNIRYVLLHKTQSPPDFYAIIRKFDTFILYQVPSTGYFDVVDAPAVFYGNKTGFYSPNARWLSSPLPKLKENPIIELGNKPENTNNLPVFSFQQVNDKLLANMSRVQSAAGEILDENVSTNHYRAHFVANRDSYLMVKSGYHPGWEVTLDDKKVEPVMLAPGFIGINVTPGTHEAVFSYHPPSYRLPLLVLGILVLVVLAFYPGKISKKIRVLFKRG